MAKTELYLGIGKDRTGQGRHWLLMLRAPDSPTCTWYHILAAPWKSICNVHYAVDIKAGKPFDAPGVVERHHIGDLDEAGVAALDAAAGSVRAQFCQTWVVEVLQGLEDKGVVAPMTTERCRGLVEQRDMSSVDGEGDLDQLPRAPTLGV